VTRRPNAQITILLCTCMAGLAAPAMGQAAASGGSSSGRRSSGGGSSGGGSSGGASYQGGSSQGTGSATPMSASVSSSANGMTISTRPASFLPGQLVLRGRVPSRDAGDAVELQRSAQQTGARWVATVTGTVQSNGSFKLVWRTNAAGRFQLRALLQRSRGAGAANGWPTLTVTIYGPGFYRHRTACGEVLHRQTLGVANRTIACGTRISIYYRGKTITVPVIDRGPYSNGASWDLTEATARALGMSGTATIGAASVPRSG
jgi:rare lipoprotein A